MRLQPQLGVMRKSPTHEGEKARGSEAITEQGAVSKLLVVKETGLETGECHLAMAWGLRDDANQERVPYQRVLIVCGACPVVIVLLNF